MKAVVTGKQMKAIDTYTIQELGIPSLVLMERAGWSMVSRMLPHITEETSILCVCGTGNNGGDAVCVARILYSMGYDASFYVVGSFEKCTEETKKQIQIARNIGVVEYNELDLEDIEVIVDGLFGIGLSDNVRRPYDIHIERLNMWREWNPDKRIWSVDIPSGVSSDTGQVLGAAIQADYTVTFGYKKCGMILYPGRELCGQSFVEDIGFPPKALKACPPDGFVCEKDDLVQIPEREADSNKGDYGKILIVAGSKNMSGAAAFAAEAAYRCGAGLVRILTPEANRIILQTLLPQAMLSIWEEMDEENLKNIAAWADAVVLGPGIGTDVSMKNDVERLLPVIKCPIIIDADGLNLLASNEMWYDKLNNLAIVTPHMGEMSRLTGMTIEQLKANRAEAAKVYAKQHHMICVLKDSSTVITDGNLVCFNETGNSGMATGGSGDVLAGIIGACLGFGLEPFEAAYLGTYIHGLAGDMAAKSYGSYGMTSRELIKGLAEVMKFEIENRG